MRWPVVVLVGYLLVGLEMGLSEFLRIGNTNAAPSFVVPFVVFVALFAPQLAALWTALLLGLTIDLATRRGETASVIIGPHALGCLLAAYLVVTVRPIMMRRNPLTLMVLSIIATGLAQLVVVSFFSIRSVYPDPFAWFPLVQFRDRMLGSFYTAATSLLLSVILFPLLPLFGFHDPQSRRPISRRDQ